MSKFMQKLMTRVKEIFDFDGAVIPICPYCEKDINPASFSREGGAMYQKLHFEFLRKMYATTFFTNIFFCPHCRKILGISRAIIPPDSSS
ncbi:MAG: hypothetical protein ACFFG0_29115 [Candidatus Thorarchaeota archaeon]